MVRMTRVSAGDGESLELTIPAESTHQLPVRRGRWEVVAEDGTGERYRGACDVKPEALLILQDNR